MSHLKGVATIQLFDAKTGKLQNEIREENMITNAVEECLNLPDYISMGLDVDENRSHNMVPYRNPLADNFFNGILIYQNKIEENAAIVMPPYDNPEIGHAGDLTSAVLDHQGTYNTTESGVIQDGKGIRRVWDFSTDRANGKISCVCLTSRAGGTLGEWRQQTYQLGGTVFTSSMSDNQSNNIPYYIKHENWQNKWDSQIKFFYMEQLNNGNIKLLGIAFINKQECIVEIVLASPFKQKLNSYANTVISQNIVYSVGQQDYNWYDWYKDGNLESDPGREYCYNETFKKATRGTESLYSYFSPYVYKNKIHIIYAISGGIRHIILNLDTYEEEQNKIIDTEIQPQYHYNTIEHTSTTNNPPAYLQAMSDGSSKWVYPRGIYTYTEGYQDTGIFYFDNHYFYKQHSKNNLIITDQNGKTFQTITGPSWITNVYIDEKVNYVLIGEHTNSYREGLYLLKKQSDNNYSIFWHEISRPYNNFSAWTYLSNAMNAPMKVKEKSMPFYCYGAWGGINDSYRYFSIVFAYIYTFLSTINNLSTPVTKTNGQTMKITYDIIQEDD